MECKDIDTTELLKYVWQRQRELCIEAIGQWPALRESYELHNITRVSVMRYQFEPPYSEMPEKLLRAKLRKLVNQDLLDGCVCGCSGAFELTPKGQAHILEPEDF